VRNLGDIKGIPFQAAIRFRQLLITGPPGSGKSTLVKALGGWPEEGYLDLAMKRWWRSRLLTFRPREIHLGIPFRGFEESQAMFEDEWLHAEEPPELDLDRIILPPDGGRWGALFNWRKRFVFEFLMPPAQKIFDARRERSSKQTHKVDLELSLEHVERQVAAYWSVAEHLHHSGLIVHVRDDFDAPPKAFALGLSEPESKAPSAGPVEGSSDGAEDGVARQAAPRVVREPLVWDGSTVVRVTATKLKVRLEDLPIALTLGPQQIQAHREVPLGEGIGAWPESVLLLDPEQYNSTVSGFVRLSGGMRTRIGKGEEDRQIASRLPSEMVPPLEISNSGKILKVVDLYSPMGTVVRPLDDADKDQLCRDRRKGLERVREIYGGPLEPLDSEEALETVRAVIRQMASDSNRPRSSHGVPGTLVELPGEVAPILVGDLHGNLDNLLKILSENRFLDDLEAGRAALVCLGDAVHREEDGKLREMTSSVVMMDLFFKLMLAFPERVYYLLGNHDSFSDEVTKEGVDQGPLWRNTLCELRGEGYADLMQSFYDLSPVVAVSTDFVACHAGPPQGAIRRADLVELRLHPKLKYQLTWTRLRRPGRPAGYTRRDVKVFQRSVGLAKRGTLVVSHNPRDDGNTLWWELGGIKRHHLVYSARKSKVAVITRVNGRLVPMVWPAEDLSSGFDLEDTSSN
jgi:energy-coupling factor transporter ATP-binding protein EcfA2